MGEERVIDNWLAEKTEHSIEQIIILREILQKHVDQTKVMAWGETLEEYLDGEFYPMLYDLTKILSLAYDNQAAWSTKDRNFILQNGKQGLQILIGKYRDWDFLEKKDDGFAGT